MFASRVRQAIEVARPLQFDDIAKTIWKALASGLLEAQEAQELAEAVEARRALWKAAQSVPKTEQRRVGSRPKSAASLERRRRWVAAGLLPPRIAAAFTQGEAAALAVITVEVEKRGRCELFLGAIAATAGVSVTTVKNAVREARRLGLVDARERRMSWTRNASNVITIISPEWKVWLRLGSRRGGGKSAPPTPTKESRRPFTAFEGAKERAAGRFLDLLARSRQRSKTN